MNTFFKKVALVATLITLSFSAHASHKLEGQKDLTGYEVTLTYSIGKICYEKEGVESYCTPWDNELRSARIYVDSCVDIYKNEQYCAEVEKYFKKKYL